MIRSTCRTARKYHRCTYGCSIRPGEQYLESVASPNHEGVTPDAWSRLAECAECAGRYGRGYLFT